MKNLINSKLGLGVTFTIIGLVLGWLFFGVDPDTDSVAIEGASEIAEEITYTCAMHPQIRQNEPGDCPICGMELIPVNEISSGPGIIEMSKEAAVLANIQTSVVNLVSPEKKIYLQGKVAVDERRVSSQSSEIPGRIEKLYVSFTGESVKAGQKLVSVYSPQLISAQKELFEAIKTAKESPILYKAARNKLKQWKLTNEQIDELEQAGEVQEQVDIRAEISGVVLKRNVSVGDHVKTGSQLFVLADLNYVWIQFDAYEADIPWIKIGDEVEFSVSSSTGTAFKEKVTFIDPIINAQTRTASIRLEVKNKQQQLKPEMFASGTITASLPLKQSQLTVPKSAVMWTGKRSVVYVDVSTQDKPMFEFREITLGHDLGGYFIVEDGLVEGESVVTNGTFKVDAAAQLAGKKSMMNSGGGNARTGHQHGETMSREMMEKSNLVEANLLVFGNCGMCKDRIEKAAMSIAGVDHAIWNKDTKNLTVHHKKDKTDVAGISKTIAAVGHDTELDKSSVGIYNELPACCQYSRKED